jgi:osmotically-inducible protein OsmY
MRSLPWGVAALCTCLAVSVAGCAAFAGRGLLESPADAKISAEVRTLLAQSSALEAPNLVSVQTLDGVVYLRGLVSTPYQIGEAGSLAARAAGASHVENLLSIDNAR